MASSDTERLAEVRKVLEGFDGGEELLQHDTIADAVECVCEEVLALRRIMASYRRPVELSNIHKDREKANAEKG